MKNHFMLDVETTGLNPCQNYVTSVGIVQFKLEREGDNFGATVIDGLNFALIPDRTSRIKDPATMKFRKENNIDLMEKGIKKQYVAAELLAALCDLNEWINSKLDTAAESPILWAHHDKFDVTFIEGYYREANVKPAWSHRDIVDLDSYIYGLLGVQYGTVANNVKFNGEPHLALADARYQVDVLDAALKQFHDQ